MIRFGKGGLQYNLQNRLAGGGEGDIFDISTYPNLVAKIYKPGKANRDKELKLVSMLNYPPNKNMLSQIAWPQDVLYDAGQFVGFTMLKMKINEDLNVIYEYGQYAKYPNLSWRDKIGIAKNICAVLDSIHDNGNVCGDLNPKNISVDPVQGLIVFLDTDSYHIRDGAKTYRCDVGIPEYLPAEIQRKMRGGYNLATAPLPTFSQDSDNFALAIHVFQLLMNGIHPFACAILPSHSSVIAPQPADNIEKGEFPFITNISAIRIPIFAPEITILPVKMQKLFQRAFIDGHKTPNVRPKPIDWFEALEELKQNLTNCNKKAGHQYDRGLSSCPWCVVDDNVSTGTRNPMPIRRSPPKQDPIKPPPTSSIASSIIKEICEDLWGVISVIVFVGITIFIIWSECFKEKKESTQPAGEVNTPVAQINPLEGTRWEYVDRDGKKFLMTYGKEEMLFTCVNRYNVSVMPQSRWKYTLNDNALTIINEDSDERYVEKYNYSGAFIKSISNPSMVYTQVTSSTSAQTPPNGGNIGSVRQNPTDDAKRYFNLGNDYFDKKDYDRAIVNYTEAIRLDPKYTIAYNDRGAAYSNKNDYNRAIADYTEAIRLDPKLALPYKNRGNAYYYKKDYDRAIADYTEAIRLNPKDAMQYVSMGNAYFDKKDYDRAIADYTEAIRLNPNYAAAYNNRGNAYVNKKDYDRAIADYTNAIRLDPKTPTRYNNRGNAYYNKKDYDRAIADYTEAIRLDPNYAQAYKNRGDAYKLNGDNTRAKADYAQAKRLDPNLK
jgi:tetratricopeptide (TPR) repeat protein